MPAPAGTTRLTVNIGQATHDALNRYMEREGATQTEALRRLVAIGDLVYQATKVDGVDVLIERDGRLERIVLI
jgi:hypothetical protein